MVGSEKKFVSGIMILELHPDAFTSCSSNRKMLRDDDLELGGMQIQTQTDTDTGDLLVHPKGIRVRDPTSESLTEEPRTQLGPQSMPRVFR
jgi:hypothetical protein